MWVFTKDGFFSTVADDRNKGNVLVRARLREDLTQLVKLFPNQHISITSSPQADYAYRITMPRKLWKQYLSKACDELDYPNFKATVPMGDRARHLAYMGVWNVMRRFQDTIDCTFKGGKKDAYAERKRK